MDLDAVLAGIPPSGTASTGPNSATTWPPAGHARLTALFALDWVRRSDRRWVVRVTQSGQENLPATLGLAARLGSASPGSHPLIA